MAEKKKAGGNTALVVRKLAEPIAKELGLTVWDVRFVKEGGYWYLRIFIDKEEGVGIDDCEAMSRAINKPLDELDPIDQAYCLEVCSPGINRELTRPEHFEAFLDWAVALRLIRPNEKGEREIAGLLRSYENGLITLEDEDGQSFSIDKKEVSSVHIIEELMEDEEDE